jgi:hypothetical protein
MGQQHMPEPQSAKPPEATPDARRKDRLPAAARLTDLPLPWVILTLILCLGVAELAQRVESRHLIERAESTGLIEPEQAEHARRGDELVRQREEIQRRMREVRERQRELERLTERPTLPTEAPTEAEHEPSIPLSLEALRNEIRAIAGESYGAYRRWGTLVALLIGGFGLILMAVFVRALVAAVLGGLAAAAAFFLRLDGWLVWAAGGFGALVGALLAPRLLLANMLVNVTLAGVVLGGVTVGGGVYLATLSELYAIFGLAAGALVGALLGFKYSRQLFLCAVLVNAAGFGTFVLWLLWGDVYPHFWALTFGGLMVLDAVATRVYHKVRWQRHDKTDATPAA